MHKIVVVGAGAKTEIIVPGSEKRFQPLYDMMNSEKDKSVATAMAVCIAGAHAQNDRHFYGVIHDSGSYEVIYCGEDSKMARSCIPVIAPDVVLVSFDLDHGFGNDFVRFLKSAVPSIEVIAFSSDPTPCKVYKMLDAGACAFLDYNSPTEEIMEAVAAAAHHRYYCNRLITTNCLNDWRHYRNMPEPSPIDPPDKDTLSVIECISQGQNHLKAAKTTGIKKRDVGSIVKREFDRTNSKNAPNLVFYYCKMGWL